MLTENIYHQIAEMEREIAVLPEGSITKKKIRGKDYYYHRITRDGKRIETYVSFEQAPDLKEKIEKRKALEKKLRELKRLVPKEEKSADSVPEFPYACAIQYRQVRGRTLLPGSGWDRVLPRRYGRLTKTSHTMIV